jgi:hypothetical protein
MGMHVLALQLLPGKTEAFKEFAAALENDRKAEYEDALKRFGGLKERAYFGPSAGTDTVVYIIKGRPTIVNDVLKGIGASTAPFDQWFTKSMRDLHGLDLSKPDPLPDAKLIYKVKPEVPAD